MLFGYLLEIKRFVKGNKTNIDSSNLPIDLWDRNDRYYYPHFPGKETEAKRN